jgi:hypothetical protein
MTTRNLKDINRHVFSKHSTQNLCDVRLSMNLFQNLLNLNNHTIIISPLMCTIQCHIRKFQSLISFHFYQIFIPSSNLSKWYSHLYKMFWPAYIIPLNLPKPSGNYIFHKLEHSKTLCCPPIVFMHCVSIPT